MATEYNIEGHFMAQISVLIQNVVPTDDFYTENESKNIKKKRKKYDREKAWVWWQMAQKWPKFHHFWICGHYIAMTSTKIDIYHISVISKL